jgi:acyl carrier protein
MAIDVETARAGQPLGKARRVPTEADEAAPRPGMERNIAAIWQEILKRDGIARTDDFFDLGGTSLDLIRVFAQVNKQFGLSVDGSLLDDEATIARMAKCIEATMRVPA